MVLHTYPQGHREAHTHSHAHAHPWISTYMFRAMCGLWFLWLFCSNLPLCLGAGAVQCTEWTFRFPPNPPQTNGHNIVAGTLWDKKTTDKGRGNYSPDPKVVREKTPDLSPHLNIRNPKQQPREDPNAAYQVGTASKHGMEQPELWGTRAWQRAFHTLWPCHLPTPSLSKWVSPLPSSDLLLQASEDGIRTHTLSLRHDKNNIFQFTGVFTYKEKNYSMFA